MCHLHSRVGSQEPLILCSRCILNFLSCDGPGRGRVVLFNHFARPPPPTFLVILALLLHPGGGGGGAVVFEGGVIFLNGLFFGGGGVGVIFYLVRKVRGVKV